MSATVSVAAKGPHFKTYIKNVFPAIFDMSIYSICTMLTGMIASRYLGVNAMGAVSVASPYISLIYAYGLIFGVGGATVISIHLGQGKKDEASRIFTANLIFMGITVSVIALLAFAFTPALADLLGATPKNRALVIQYLKVITLFSLPYSMSYTMGLMLKADGHPLWGIIGSSACAVCQIVLLFVLTTKTGLGIYGLAYASAVSQLILLALYTAHFFRKKATLKFVKTRIDLAIIRRIIFVGIPDALSEGSSGIFVLIFNYLAFRAMGETGIVVFSVINFINLTAVQLMLGVTQGMQPLSSFYYGRNDMKTSRLYLKFAYYIAGFLSLAMFLICFFATETVVRMYIDPTQAEAYQACLFALKRFSYFLLPFGFSVVSIGYFASIEKAGWAQTLSVGRSIVVIGGLGIAMTNLWGAAGMWSAPFCTEMVTLLVAGVFFWKLRSKPNALLDDVK